MFLHRVDQPDQPRLQEICESKLPENELRINQLDLVGKLLHVGLCQFSLKNY